MKLSAAHMEGFDKSAQDTYIEALSADLRKTCRRHLRGVSDHLLHARVAYGISRARRYGFVRGYAMAAFISLMIQVAPHFDEHTEVRRALRDFNRPADKRMRRLLRNHTDRDWNTVRRQCDPDWPEDLEEHSR